MKDLKEQIVRAVFILEEHQYFDEAKTLLLAFLSVQNQKKMTVTMTENRYMSEFSNMLDQISS